jgi:sporulation protein YlmC with PRC-barrel domain
MDLVRDLLDKEVVDRNGREIGRVDSIVVELRDAAGPRVAAIEIGPAVLAYRVHRVFGRWMAAFEHAIRIDEGRPLRIPFSDIIEIDDHVKVDLAFGETAAAALESRLRGWMR